MLGQIATFMESLHVSYDEAFEKIPYRNLVLMSRDKLHVVFGKERKKVTKVSGREMAQRRRRNRK